MLDQLAPGTTRRGITAHNTAECMSRAQRAGTVVVAMGRLCDTIPPTDGVGHDHGFR